MKKMRIIMLALAAMTLGSSVQAHEISAQETQADFSADEQTFLSKLSETHRTLFSAMTAEQKTAAMTASLEPDQAVEQVIQSLSTPTVR